MDAPLLDIEHCTLRFGGLTAVDDLSTAVKERSLTGLIGPNGAGKTSVFNLITGVYRPTSGEIRFAGQSIVGLRPFQITRLGIARTFQNIRLFPSLSVFDTVRSVVLLPAPLLPMSVTMAPWGTVSEMPCKALIAP